MKNRIRTIVLIFIVMSALFVSSGDGQGAINHQATEYHLYLPVIMQNHPLKLKQLAFLGFDTNNTANIYTVNNDGSQLTNLTVNSSRIGTFSWSPDGNKIVFSSTRDGNREIYVMNYDGTDLKSLSNHAANDNYPTWSPDGTKIAFASDRDGVMEIYVVNSDGSGLTRLTYLSGCSAPLWSPAEDKIGFTIGTDNEREIYVMDGQGSGLTRLTNNVYYDKLVEWSPDGQRVLFISNRDTGGEAEHYDLFVMQSDGTGIIQLTKGGYGSHGSWSPDGSKVVYTDGAVGSYGTFIINADGSGKRLLTAYSSHPVWSSDGTQIAYSLGVCGSNTCGIYVINADGGSPIYIVGMLALDPNWRPGNSRMEQQIKGK